MSNFRTSVPFWEHQVILQHQDFYFHVPWIDCRAKNLVSDETGFGMYYHRNVEKSGLG